MEKITGMQKSSISLHTLLNLRPEKVKNWFSKMVENYFRVLYYLRHLNSNFDSVIYCFALSRQCQWSHCPIGHGKQRIGNNGGDKTTSDSQ